MKVRFFALPSLIMALVLALSGAGITQGPQSLSASPSPMGDEPVVGTGSDPAQVTAALRSNPVMFIENVGQFDERARFQVRGAQATRHPTGDAENVELVGHIGGAWARAVAVQGDYAYVATESNGLRVIDISDPANPREVGCYCSSERTSGIFVSGSRAYLAIGEGIDVLNVSDPSSPYRMGSFGTSGSAMDVVVVDYYAYVATWGALQIVDVSNPARPRGVGAYKEPWPLGYFYGVSVSGDYACVASERVGLYVLDISDPIAPRLLGTFYTAGWSYDVQVVDSYAYVAAGGLSIVDISDPHHPIKVGYYPTGYALGVFVSGPLAYVADRDTGLWVLDVSDPGNPRKVGYHDLGKWASWARDVVVAGDHIYVASGDGLWILRFIGGPGPTYYSISGRVRDGNGNPIAGVTISDGAGHTATADSNGNYTLSGLAAGTYTITPSKSGHTFSPASRTVNVPPDAAGKDFTAMLITYSISGRVTDVNNNPVPGITISDGAGHATITDGNGNYILDGLASGTYTLIPSKGAEWTFRPSSHTVSVPPDATGKDFKGYDKAPIVFVHGWGGLPPWGPCEWPDPDENFQSVDDYLRAAGYYVAYARLETSPCYTPPLIENVPCLLNAIALAKTATNQRHVILIAHSMGGLVSRAYIEGPDYDDDVAALFTFGSPHLGVPADALVFLFNGATLGQVCKDYQPVVCDFSTLGMILFNHDHPTRAAGVTYHVISGDAPFSPRSVLGKALYGLLRPDDGLVQTSSGTGLSGILDRFVTDETHGPGSGPRSYFIRDGGPSTSYMQCLKPVLVDKTSSTCGSVGPSQIAVQAISALPGHTPLEYGTLLAGQTVTRTVWLEGGPTLLASQWQTGTVAFTLVDPNGQVIDPAYVATHPEVATYEAEATAAIYYFPNASAGRWRLVLEGEDDIPPGGSNYVTFAAFESAVRISGGTDHNWYIPGATVVITASFSGSPASAVVTATILYADGTGETVSLLPQGGGEYQATFTVPNVPGYVEVRLVATGTTAGQIPFERGTSLVFQISSGSVALSGVYSDAPQPRSAGSSLYQALLVTAGVEVTLGGEVGLSADLVDAEGQFVAHALTIEEVAAGSGSLTLRFDGDDIYASQRSGPYTLTNLLLTDHRGVPLVLAEAENVYTTAAYDYRSFDREKIYLSLVLRNR